MRPVPRDPATPAQAATRLCGGRRAPSRGDSARHNRTNSPRRRPSVRARSRRTIRSAYRRCRRSSESWCGPLHRLCDEANRVGEIDHPRRRRAFGDFANVAVQNGHRADAHREAAGSHRFLSDDASRERDRFVVLPGGEAADTDAGDDEIGVGDAVAHRFVERDRRAAPNGRPPAARSRRAARDWDRKARFRKRAGRGRSAR